jgi:hypothetical protein
MIQKVLMKAVNRNNAVQPLFKNCKKQYVYSSTEDLIAKFKSLINGKYSYIINPSSMKLLCEYLKLFV